MDEELRRHPSLQNLLRAGGVFGAERVWVHRFGGRLLMKQGNNLTPCDHLIETFAHTGPVLYDSQARALGAAYNQPAETQIVELIFVAVEVSSLTKAECERAVERTRLEAQIAQLQKKLEELDGR